MRYADPTQNVTFSDTIGVLECIDHSARWCGHIQEALRTALDAQGIWLEDDEGNALNLSGAPILVPLVPSMDVYAWVTLGDRVGDSYVVWVIGLKQNPVEESIGLLLPGEGRQVLRDMLIPFVEMNVGKFTHCKSASHRPSTEIALRSHLRARVGRIAETYSILTTEMCVECQFTFAPSTLPGSDDFADLIPEV